MKKKFRSIFTLFRVYCRSHKMAQAGVGEKRTRFKIARQYKQNIKVKNNAFTWSHPVPSEKKKKNTFGDRKVSGGKESQSTKVRK